jgi:tape measure domain-containing protein
VAQSTVRLIVDAQNAINPLKRVNDQTKLLSQNTNKLKGRLDKSNKSIRNTGTSAKTAQSGVKGLVGALKPLLAALAVVGSARFVFVKTAELESQRKSLEVLTGSVEKTNQIIKEMQDFGAVTPFTSSQLIEITKRMKAFGVETEKVTDMTRRIADIAGTAGADIDSVSLAIGKVVAKNKFQQEENIMLLEKGINVTEELQRMTGMSAEALADAMSDGAISADQFRQAIVNLTSEGGEFFGGASAQADTLNGRLSTLQDTVETLARSIGEELGDEIKTVLNLAIDAVGQITKLVERVGTANKVGRINLANIAMEARGEARQKVRQEKGFFAPLTGEGRAREKELFEEIKAAKIKEALDARELKTLDKKDKKTKEITNNIKQSNNEAKETTLAFEKTITPTNLLNENLGKTNLFVKSIDKNIFGVEETSSDLANNFLNIKTSLGNNVTTSDLFNERLNQTSFLVGNLSLGSDKFAESLSNVKSEADILNEKFMEIGQSVEQGIVSNLTDAVMGTKSLADAAISVLNDLKRKLVEVALQRATAGIGNRIGGFLGGLFGGGKKSGGGLFSGGGGGVGFGSVNLGISSGLGFANGGRPPVGKASLVGERGPEMFVPTSSGTIIPNNMIGGGGVTNMVTVNVDASGSAVQGSTTDAQQLGQIIGQAVQEQLVKEKRPGGLLT